MAQTYIDMFPEFIPDECADVSVSEQKVFYTLIRSLYQLAFDEPMIFVASLHEDDVYPNRFNKSSYGKPKLTIDMKKFMKSVDGLLHSMFLLGRGAGAKPDQRQLDILSRLGVGDLGRLPPAWTWMATRTGAGLPAFSHCFFRGDYPYLSDIYARLLGEEAFRKLESWMAGRGYKWFAVDRVTASDCKVSLTYANPAWGSDRPPGGFEYKIRHTGISARYDFYCEQPAVFGLCIPNGLKRYLEAFDSMNKGLQAFVIGRTKKCDGCKYCIQTDKTGKRPMAVIPVNFEGERYNLCPYYPGYSYSWTGIDDGLADQLIEMLEFMDRFAPNKVQ